MVFASGGRQPPPPPSPPLSPPSSYQSWQKPSAPKPESLENPGTVEELFNKVRETQPNCFEGAKIMLNKALSNHFQMSHTIHINNTSPSYHFQSIYAGTQKHTATEAYPVLLADLDGQGNLNCNVIHQVSKRLRCKIGADFQPGAQNTPNQATADYRGDDCTFSLTMASPGLATRCGMIVASLLQSVAPRWAVGAELAYQCGYNVPGGQNAIVSMVGRYDNGQSMSCAKIGPTGIHLGHYRKCSDQLQIGLEVETCLRTMASVATIAYQSKIQKGDVQFRASLDTGWRVCGELEKRLQHSPFTFLLSGCMMHKTGQFKMGAGVIIG
ncbi:mitochondrial import receptor subunit TOM40 homolog 1 [Drosophila pseudoobscura]|uniref:Mitochondrial import receptor subunit TOM40 homolog 1 n=1 Tax=Drosophila pseudoobscura pseudoobscura TaxID=46245 RepID=A0A6I8V4Y8_DROPS|nr:mitochondrial import receptor subunit TOM40 homolog 1 [Drosophila pseudoobscura]